MGWQTGGGAVDPSVWVEKVKDAPRNAINAACFACFSDVVLRTPVDTGAARGGWLCSPDQPETGMGEPDKSGRDTINKIKVVLENVKGDQSVFLTSSVPYIKMLEFGGYGKANGQGKSLIGRKRVVPLPKGDNPVQKKKKKNEGSKITAEGRSLQSPLGMVGLAMQKWQKHLDDAIRFWGGGGGGQ
jgi:hypothetical protein